MSGSHVLVTGGAGFVGSHLADALLERGDRVRVLDALLPQVHGPERTRPLHLDPRVELVEGDVRDPKAVRHALEGIDAVVHLAARVGVGQSMYEIADYVGANAMGTGVLLEALTSHPIRRLVVASSMGVYGEGLYIDSRGGRHEIRERQQGSLRRGDWEVRSGGGETLQPVPTPESKSPGLTSVYALTKYDQERLTLVIGAAYQIPVVALRFFNIYGPRQALSNPYTGVIANFASRLLNDRRPMVFEDGRQRRDFVHVSDAVQACLLALDRDQAVGQLFNVGSGSSCSVREVAQHLAVVMQKPDLRPEITGKYRVGDVRHCFADISLARSLLGYEPGIPLNRGLAELASWLSGEVAEDRVPEASAELAKRGLTF